MKYDIDRLISIAKDTNMLSEEAQLAMIQQRLSDANCELILPLVGEFSAGKTTLINSLTDSKKLETATKPTTKTIYEIHFGCDSCYAEVFDENGIKREVKDLSLLKNDELSDSAVINIFDISTQVPSGIILVDTPGLSSSDPRHKQTLVDFLPSSRWNPSRCGCQCTAHPFADRVRGIYEIGPSPRFPNHHEMRHETSL